MDENRKSILLRQLAEKNDELAQLVASRPQAQRLDKEEKDKAVFSLLKTIGFFSLILVTISLIRVFACSDAFSPVWALILSVILGYAASGFGSRNRHEHETELDRQISQAHKDIARITRELEWVDHYNSSRINDYDDDSDE